MQYFELDIPKHTDLLTDLKIVNQISLDKDRVLFIVEQALKLVANVNPQMLSEYEQAVNEGLIPISMPDHVSNDIELNIEASYNTAECAKKLLFLALYRNFVHYKLPAMQIRADIVAEFYKRIRSEKNFEKVQKVLKKNLLKTDKSKFASVTDCLIDIYTYLK